jgi:hypothetical protein
MVTLRLRANPSRTIARSILSASPLPAIWHPQLGVRLRAILFIGPPSTGQLRGKKKISQIKLLDISSSEFFVVFLDLV